METVQLLKEITMHEIINRRAVGAAIKRANPKITRISSAFWIRFEERILSQAEKLAASNHFPTLMADVFSSLPPNPRKGL